MSAPDKPDLARGARHAEALFEAETDRLVAMSDADFERAMDDLPPPSRVPSVDELLTRAKERARARQTPAHPNALPTRPRKTRWTFAIAAAALATLAVVLLLARRDVIAWIHGPDAPVIGPDPARGPTPYERAEALRDQAAKACAGALWGLCVDKLDAASALDPAGDTTPRVQSLRATITANTTRPLKDPKAP